MKLVNLKMCGFEASLEIMRETVDNDVGTVFFIALPIVLQEHIYWRTIFGFLCDRSNIFFIYLKGPVDNYDLKEEPVHFEIM